MGLAEADEAGTGGGGEHRGVAVGRAAGEQRRAALGGDAGGVEEVLPGDRHAVERAAAQPGAGARRGGGGLGAGALGRGAGVDRRRVGMARRWRRDRPRRARAGRSRPAAIAPPRAAAVIESQLSDIASPAFAPTLAGRGALDNRARRAARYVPGHGTRLRRADRRRRAERPGAGAGAGAGRHDAASCSTPPASRRGRSRGSTGGPMRCRSPRSGCSAALGLWRAVGAARAADRGDPHQRRPPGRGRVAAVPALRRPGDRRGADGADRRGPLPARARCSRRSRRRRRSSIAPAPAVVGQAVGPGAAVVTLADGTELAARARSSAATGGRAGWRRVPASAGAAGTTARPRWSARSRTSGRTGGSRTSSSCRRGRSPSCRCPATARRSSGPSARDRAAAIGRLDDAGYLAELRPRFGDFLGDIAPRGRALRLSARPVARRALDAAADRAGRRRGARHPPAGGAGAEPRAARRGGARRGARRRPAAAARTSARPTCSRATAAGGGSTPACSPRRPTG